MIDASKYSSTEILKNGLEICIRATRPDDWERVLAAFHELDSESIYFRFFGHKKEFTSAEVRQFRETDFKSRVRLIATLNREGDEVVIAAASYARIGAAAAEVAFVVEEDYHRLGIARRLLRHLGTIATDAGVEEFVAEVLPSNAGMLGVFGSCGWPMSSRMRDGAVHVTLALGNDTVPAKLAEAV